MTLPTGLLLLANVLDVVTCQNLHYREAQYGHDSRPIAAADIVNNDWVRETDAIGQYRVRSRILKQDNNPVWYRVTVGDELTCECSDHYMRPYAKSERYLEDGENPKDFRKPIICCHILSAVMVHAMKLTFEEQP